MAALDLFQLPRQGVTVWHILEVMRMRPNCSSSEVARLNANIRSISDLGQVETVTSCAKMAEIAGPIVRPLVDRFMEPYRHNVHVLDQLFGQTDLVVNIVVPRVTELARRYYLRIIENVPSRDVGHLTRLFWLNYRFDTPFDNDLFRTARPMVLDRVCYNIAAHLDWLLLRPRRVDYGMNIFVQLNRINTVRPSFLQRWPVFHRQEILTRFLREQPQHCATISNLIPI